MAKANQNANGVALVKGGTDKKQNATWKSRALLWVGTCMVMATCLVGSASAATINWTEMIDLVNGVTGVMPSFGNLIMAAVPIILILSVVGFTTGLFDSILDGISSAFKVFKR
ncbi:hypothetical protein V7O61_08375 [Methanolobus sp. WCC1]|jgi:hypothetical protein|uniref:hypothetical protein n=1 Tax=unclassified Methanolobus TaxID=2629569 RepID=UPI0032436D28